MNGVKRLEYVDIAKARPSFLSSWGCCCRTTMMWRPVKSAISGGLTPRSSARLAERA